MGEYRKACKSKANNIPLNFSGVIIATEVVEYDYLGEKNFDTFGYELYPDGTVTEKSQMQSAELGLKEVRKYVEYSA